MQPYINKTGKKSRITAFETGEDFIVVEFNYKKRHKYSFSSTGSIAVETMKKHAQESQGLSTYISQNNPTPEQDYLKIFPFFISKLSKNGKRDKTVI